MATDRFWLKRPLSPDRQVEVDDILQTKRALNQLGYYGSEHGLGGGWVDSDLFSGIRRLQKENGLKQDGVINPVGETASRINYLLQHANSANDNAEAANDNNDDVVLADCFSQYEKDSMICRSLLSPEARGRCWASAAERLAACRTHKPKPRLQT